MNTNFEPIKRTKQRANVSDTTYTRLQAKKNTSLRQQARKNKRLTLAAEGV